MKPVLIIISGESATGKTELAKRLAHELHLPYICRDDIKDAIFNTLGWKDRAWSIQVGVASYEILYRISGRFLDAGVSHILESNFHTVTSGKFMREHITKHPCTIIRIHLHAKSAVLHARYAERAKDTTTRHPGHVDLEVLEGWKENVARGKISPSEQPMELPGKLLEIDTSDFASVDHDAIARAVWQAMNPA